MGVGPLQDESNGLGAAPVLRDGIRRLARSVKI